MAHNFKQLLIWQKSMDLTDHAYNYCKQLPPTEKYNLIDQINRSSCSIPTNIAEGSGKRSKLEFAQYLSTSLSSSYELETHILICERRDYGKEKERSEILILLSEIQKRIFTFRERVINEK